MGLSQWSIADGAQVLLGRGALFFDRFAPGTMTKQGARPLGNCTALEINPTTETKEKRGSVDNTNPLIARVETSRTLELNITLSEYRPFNLALALLGDQATDYTQAATPVVDEVLTTSAKKGGTYFAAKRKGGTISLKGGVAGATAMTLDTDYYVDSESMAVYAIPAGAIADGDTLKISYTPTAVTTGSISQVNIGTAGTIIGELRFLGNPMNGKTDELVLYKVQMLPSGALPFIGDDFSDFQLKGTLLSDAANHATTPYGILYQR